MTQLTPWWPKAAAATGAAAMTFVVFRHLRRLDTLLVVQDPAREEENVDEVGVNDEARQLTIQKYVSEVGSKLGANTPADAVMRAGDIAKFLAFGESFRTLLTVRPDVGQGELLKVTDWYRLTPENYDRTTFHVEVDVAGTGIEELVNGANGKALSVYATNDFDAVSKFLKVMGLDPFQVIACDEIAPQEQDGLVVLTTVQKLFVQFLDIFGKPTKEFLKKLTPYAHDILEKIQIAELTLDRKQDEFLDRQARSFTYADYLMEFKSLNIPVEKYLDIVPTIKQRVYSICSSSDYRPGKCQLLVVREDWGAKGGETKYGFCSSFLTFLRPGERLLGNSTHSVMKIPENKTAHVFMAGLGTGLAPFRAFVEQRKCWKDQGHEIGKMTLFFGGRYSNTEYYYKKELEAFEREGIVTCCNAWSRDGPQKVYVQHKIKEQENLIWEHLGKKRSQGYFFLCGSKQPEKDVYRTLLEIFQTKGNMTAESASHKMEELQSKGRYVTEVY